MSYTLAAIALGFLSFIFLVNLFSIRIPKELAVQRRLEGIKLRGAKAPISREDEEFAFLYNNFRYKFFAKHFSNLKIIDSIKLQIALSGVEMEIDTFLILSVMCAVPIAAILLFTCPQIVSLSLVGLVIPLSILRLKAQKRSAQFAQQLPDTLDLLSSSLRAGHSIYSAFEVITKEMPMPVSGVFKTSLDELTVGSDSKLAILSLSKTVPDNIDLKFFITAVILQREVGGNLAKILDSLSITIRERFKISGELRAQTAQARFSGFLLTCVPPAIAAILFVLSPEYMEPLIDTAQGNYAFGLAVFLLLVGVVLIKKIVTIEI